jgi:plasmid stabilization system protein ParE
MPEIYQVYILDYRTINHKWYKIFYKIDEIKKEVFIYHILSQKQNYINYLS